MLKDFNITPLEYQTTKPYPHMYQDDILDEKVALQIQQEILDLPDSDFDRYDNPFEQKFTLRDKEKYPPQLKLLMNYLTSEDFVKKLSIFVGYELITDPTKNFWGVHKYRQSDYLDIHVDAGRHPKTQQKKQVTLGLYLSKNWDPSYGCELEIWEGDNCMKDNAKIYKCINKIEPKFNRLIIFTCNDYSWHGNPDPQKDLGNAFRIFVTLSYLSNNQDDTNIRQKAFFIARPLDEPNEEKDKLRLLRADPTQYKNIYRYTIGNK